MGHQWSLSLLPCQENQIPASNAYKFYYGGRPFRRIDIKFNLLMLVSQDSLMHIPLEKAMPTWFRRPFKSTEHYQLTSEMYTFPFYDTYIHTQIDTSINAHTHHLLFPRNLHYLVKVISHSILPAEERYTTTEGTTSPTICEQWVGSQGPRVSTLITTWPL